MNDTKEKHATHTPGPWEVRPGENYYHVYGEVQVALVENWKVEDPKANARLIAAAPEMYEILQEILAPCPVKGYLGKYDRRRTYNARKKLREVLAKVDGGEG